MTVSIPSAAGVPGISGPPIWFSGEATFNPDLDDVRWRGAVKRTFGSGSGGSNYFRATQATVAGRIVRAATHMRRNRTRHRNSHRSEWRRR